MNRPCFCNHFIDELLQVQTCQLYVRVKTNRIGDLPVREFHLANKAHKFSKKAAQKETIGTHELLT